MVYEIKVDCVYNDSLGWSRMTIQENKGNVEFFAEDDEGYASYVNVKPEKAIQIALDLLKLAKKIKGDNL